MDLDRYCDISIGVSEALLPRSRWLNRSERQALEEGAAFLESIIRGLQQHYLPQDPLAALQTLTLYPERLAGTPAEGIGKLMQYRDYLHAVARLRRVPASPLTREIASAFFAFARACPPDLKKENGA